MQISVVIPTCNRKPRLLSLLENLNNASYSLFEVIVVDSGEDRLIPADYTPFKNLNILYLESEKSVCIQRNAGIKRAGAPWIFLCDDDIEVPPDYLQKIMEHIAAHPEAGAVSGLVLQKEGTEWQSRYPLHSGPQLLWKFIFQLSIWGEIECRSNNALIKKIKNHYRKKGNHISKAGWPVITDFSGHYFVSPVYGLGASLVKKEWLLQSPYDETLDRHGIGDNYGVAMGFPVTGIHVLNDAFVYHHQEPANRLERPLQYLRRTLALDYFIKIKPKLRHIKKGWLLWSLTGNLLSFIFVMDGMMIWPAFKSAWITAFGRNPYYKAMKDKERVVQPLA